MDELVFRVPREKFPTTIEPREGLVLYLKRPDGSVIDVVIAGMTPETVTMDANHPLADADLTFDIELMEIAQPA